MLKSYAKYLHTAIDCILLDAIDAFPHIHKSVSRDRTRVSSLANTRGLSVFTIDFPALGKHFDKCLSEGLYTKPSLPLSGTLNPSVSIPKLFQGLILQVFNQCGVLRSEPCVNSITFLRQLYAIGKKVELDCKKERVYETLSDFYTVDESLPWPDLSWRGTGLEKVRLHCVDLHVASYASNRVLQFKLERRRRRNRGLETPVFAERGEGGVIDSRNSLKKTKSVLSSLDTVQFVADYLVSTLGSFDPLEYKPKHGPGAVSDLRGKSYKYDFPNWPKQLEQIFPQTEFAYANYSQWVDHGGYPSWDNPHSNLLCVPKTQKGPRLIAAEPTAMQYCQQVIWRFLDERISDPTCWIGNSLHFRDQSYNQRLALLASKTQSHSTVDLSAASDRVTCRVVERLFRRNPFLLTALIAVRTPIVNQKVDDRFPSSHILRKYTTMGSACTFPIESIIFLMLAIASVIESRDMSPTKENIVRISKEVLVFGDDIIIPSDSGEVLGYFLDHFDFVINDSKTHRNGKFRESCGVEAYDGHDVTPSYIIKYPEPDKPESIISSVECSNNFYKKGWWRVADLIRSTVGNRRIPVVLNGSGRFGYISNIKPPRLEKSRWNNDLHCTEYQVLTTRVVAPKIPIQSGAALLQYFVEDPDPSLPWKSGVVQKSRLKLRLDWEDESGFEFTTQSGS